MNPDRQQKALSLWRGFVTAPQNLDVQAVDALLLRDELEATRVPAEELSLIRELDLTLRQRLSETVGALRTSGVLSKMIRLRTKRSLTGWWWWMDRLDAGQSIEVSGPDGSPDQYLLEDIDPDDLNAIARPPRRLAA